MSSSLELALADVEMLQAAYPDEVKLISQGDDEKNHGSAITFPLQCQICFESPNDNEQQQQQHQHNTLSLVTLEWNEGYPNTSGIQVASYRCSASISKARIEAVLTAIKQESEQCQQDEMEGGLACVAAALRAWNEYNDDTNQNDTHDNNNGQMNQDQNHQQHEVTTDKHQPCCTSKQQHQQQPTSTHYVWMSGTPLTDRKSTFQAHVCRVESEQQVHQALEQLVTSHSKMQRATHQMYAYRLMELSKGRLVLKHDNNDDGEHGAGSRLAQLLQSCNEQNVLVVVTRWYGGIQLGPKRFAHITNVARDVLVAYHQQEQQRIE